MRIGQIGTRHGHAAGKWQALLSHPDVEPVGIWEPDPALRGRSGFANAHWFTSEDELLNDSSVVAVAIEGRNHESLGMAAAAVQAGKHLWFDKPAGDDYPAFERPVSHEEAIDYNSGDLPNFHAHQLRDVTAAVREHRPPAVTGEDGRRVVAIIQGVYESGRTGRPVKL